jgi:DNA/RNA-binding domain of Phe-tRNA-synthetase-like protein
MTVFQYSPEIIGQFPNLVGGIVLAKGMKNGPAPEALCREFMAEQKAVNEQIGDRPLSEFPAIQAWRRAFSQFGVEPTKYRSATESLLRRLMKKGDIPSINTLVDIGNLISIRYRLPVAVCDTRAVQGTVTVHFANGSERYRELGSDEVIHPPAGEVVFSDETGMVMARRWCWRQSAESAAQEDTTAAFITFEAQHEGGLHVVEQARQDLLALLQSYAGGEFESAVLTANQPGI